MKRRKIFSIPAELLGVFITSGLPFKIEGVPRDAKLILTGWDYRSQTIDMVFEHASFEPVRPGDAPYEHVLSLVACDVSNSLADQLDEMKEAA